ncbi:hypothetical protein I2492_05990 [Budviciaceae bacterium CWB-B4]|uniref:Uncharacterized protein n=1 Tax=Limnobaculum xujianqingii TaxID=2738837 RepID=A0A9D7AH04_9GAMM|nr:hypothetical protein [Limnobaculum xujianqingii]MBK5072559.1 hypothetical protein [Limnobaculum xujianqingii]MBK5175868.1 hypothetical protein [Limnobaculum xujianqingii]
MNMALTMDLAFQIALGIVAFLGGWWLKNLHSELKEQQKEMKDVREQYQRRDDAHRDVNQVMDQLQEMRRGIERIEAKLDRKADKI